MKHFWTAVLFAALVLVSVPSVGHSQGPPPPPPPCPWCGH